jgi:hypothetical protein
MGDKWFAKESEIQIDETSLNNLNHQNPNSQDHSVSASK